MITPAVLRVVKTAAPEGLPEILQGEAGARPFARRQAQAGPRRRGRASREPKAYLLIRRLYCPPPSPPPQLERGADLHPVSFKAPIPPIFHPRQEDLKGEIHPDPWASARARPGSVLRPERPSRRSLGGPGPGNAGGSSARGPGYLLR